MADKCIFCEIVSGQAAADVVYDGDETYFFRDVAPAAPVHVVAITKRHITSLNSLSPDDLPAIGQLVYDIVKVAKILNLAQEGYRVITNVGDNAGQAVKHLHWHILGGENLGPLRC